jgi:hypothetical protein
MKLFYIEAGGSFECDFLLARNSSDAIRLMQATYGGGMSIDSVQCVADVGEQERAWLGPCAEPTALTAFGGTLISPPGEFPRWQFGDQVFGCLLTPTERY